MQRITPDRERTARLSDEATSTCFVSDDSLRKPGLYAPENGKTLQETACCGSVKLSVSSGKFLPLPNAPPYCNGGGFFAAALISGSRARFARRRNLMKDCWQVLGIPCTTDVEAVSRAYRSLIKRYHPDTIPSGSPEMIRHYTIKCGRINQAFRQAIERCAAGAHVGVGTAVDREDTGVKTRWEGAAEWARAWRPPEQPATKRPPSTEVQNGGAASIAVDYLAPLLVIGSPLLILGFATMLWQMVCLLAGR